MFSFSLLQGVYQLNTNEKTICFSGEVKLTVTSPLHNFCQSLADGLGAGGGLRLGMGEAKVEKIETRMPLVEKEEVVVRTLSPVVLYSTFRRPEGKKYTVYFQPGDPDYDRLLHENLYNKYRAFYGTGPPAGQVGAKALGQQKKRIIDFNGTIIQGYSGKLILTGPVPLLQLALDGGLGGKNSQGFGCLEMI
ncbi:MAG: CRISPR-associated endoribonuclease Cas6 [Clostridia bacterium]|nr:CRISPR-associated endoribonuclease Cas6 [Clostridia bacterium]